MKWTDFKGKEKEIDQIIESVQQEFDTSVFSTKVAGKGMLLCSLLQFISNISQDIQLWQYGLSCFQMGGIKWERFLPKNQHTQRKFLNFENWTGSLSRLQKSKFLKLIISFFHYFWCQNWDQWHKMSGKNTHIYFFYVWFKNKQVLAEKIGKKRKNSKNLKVAGNYPDI